MDPIAPRRWAHSCNFCSPRAGSSLSHPRREPQQFSQSLKGSSHLPGNLLAREICGTCLVSFSSNGMPIESASRTVIRLSNCAVGWANRARRGKTHWNPGCRIAEIRRFFKGRPVPEAIVESRLRNACKSSLLQGKNRFHRRFSNPSPRFFENRGFHGKNQSQNRLLNPGSRVLRIVGSLRKKPVPESIFESRPHSPWKSSIF